MMKNKSRRRINIDRGINLIQYNKTREGTKRFEVYKKRNFKTLNQAERLYNYMLTYVTDKVYLYESKGNFTVEFRTYVKSLNEAQEVRGIIEGYFTLWGGGLR